ncbi:MAG: GNAT family N-acetyltransferase [Defluviitaleaceae bacterium]|nr:GNAT family N-acetyltransferase [Defluviitaleaceae bacterium]
MNIRKMSIEDYEQIYDIWLISGNGLNDIDDSKAGIQKYLTRNPNTSFVAEENGNIIGSIMSGHDGRRGYIQHISVLPSKRNKCIGTLLVNSAIEALESDGITKVALVSFTHNNPGNNFWDKMGFWIRNDLFYRDKSLIELKRINDGFDFQ